MTASTRKTIEQVITSTNSQRFINSITTGPSTSELPRSLTLKNSLWHGISHQNGMVLQTLTNISSRPNWRHHLKPREMSFIIGNVINYQITQMVYYTFAKAFELPNKSYVKGRATKFNIRQIYSNLINTKWIYSPAVAKKLYHGETPYELTMQDYENLVTLEYNNNKLDLADKWINHCETYIGKDKLSDKLWGYKLKLNGGDARHWHDYENKTKSKMKPAPYKVARSHYQLKSYHQVLDDYLKYNGKIHHQLEPLIYCLGFNNEIDKIYKLMDNQQNLTSDCWTAMIIALAYNSKFIDLIELFKTKQFTFTINQWSKIFKYLEFYTRISRSKLLNIFLKDHPGIKSFEQLSTQPHLLREYQDFYNNYKVLRINLIRTIYGLYKQENFYSVQIYRILRPFTKHHGNNELFYEILTDIHTTINARSKSFDSKNTSSINLSIQLYDKYLKDWIKRLSDHGNNQPLITLFIDNWGLNNHHKRELTAFFATKDVEDDDKLLDLF